MVKDVRPTLLDFKLNSYFKFYISKFTSFILRSKYSLSTNEKFSVY